MQIMANEALAHFRFGNIEKTKELLAKANEIKSEKKHEKILSSMYAASVSQHLEITLLCYVDSQNFKCGCRLVLRFRRSRRAFQVIKSYRP